MTVGRIICILIGYAIGLFRRDISMEKHNILISGNTEAEMRERLIPCVHLVLKQERSRSRGIVEKQSLPFLSPG